MLSDKEYPTIPATITTKNGLLYDENGMIFLPRADDVAREYGFVYAEHMVEALKERQKD